MTRRTYSGRDRIIHGFGWILLAIGWGMMIGHQVLSSTGGLGGLGLTGVGGSAAVRSLVTLLFLAGIALIVRVRRLRAASADELLATDSRPPVLYLRSFRDDGPDPSTEAMHASGWIQPSPEEQLALAMHRIGPFIAVGRPGERLPELGAARLYVTEDRWTAKVATLIGRAQLIVLRVGRTPGFWWEVEQVMKSADLTRVLFFFGPRAEQLYQEFRDRARSVMPPTLPDTIGKAQFLYLERAGDEWNARTITLRVPRLNFMGSSAIEEMFLKGLRPIFERLGMPVPKHSFPLSYKFAIGCAVFVVLQTAASHQVRRLVERAQQQIATARLQSISRALELYHLDTGSYPTTEQGLAALVHAGSLRPRDLLDPWGRPLKYRVVEVSSESTFELLSLGSDGVEGGRDNAADIRYPP